MCDRGGPGAQSACLTFLLPEALVALVTMMFRDALWVLCAQCAGATLDIDIKEGKQRRTVGEGFLLHSTALDPKLSHPLRKKICCRSFLSTKGGRSHQFPSVYSLQLWYNIQYRESIEKHISPNFSSSPVHILNFWELFLMVYYEYQK
jgi:hypothetical protein